MRIIPLALNRQEIYLMSQLMHEPTLSSGNASRKGVALRTAFQAGVHRCACVGRIAGLGILLLQLHNNLAEISRLTRISSYYLTLNVQSSSPFQNILVAFLSLQGSSKMSLAHGIRKLGVLGAGQMGTGIALVSALRARVPVLLYDRSAEQVTKGLSLMEKLLEKDVAKGRLSSEEAKEAWDKVSVVGPQIGIKGMREVDMVIEVRFYISFQEPFQKWTSQTRLFQSLYHSSNLYLHHLQLS